jgi:hypothetical protein
MAACSVDKSRRRKRQWLRSQVTGTHAVSAFRHAVVKLRKVLLTKWGVRKQN